MPTRSIAYIDGFNLYYAALRGGPHKWLDLERLIQLLRPRDQIEAINYCTALVVGSGRRRQEVYLRALATRPQIQVLLGKFKDKRVACSVTACLHGGSRRFIVPEEKRTDVNIALSMLDDAYRGACDRMVLISGDSDLVPALDLIKTRFPQIELVVYVPSRTAVRGAAVELRGAADKHRLLPLQLLPHAQLPATIPVCPGQVISKPGDCNPK
jgi:hypothetical protein